jgi:phosphonate transport system ATP-binding protein
VLVSLHQVDMARRYCPRTVALHQGRVVFDGPSEALTPALLRELYGMQADEILNGSESVHGSVTRLPTPASTGWQQPIPQAA